jgi:cytochrome d ubiquinol oxidase subunit II
MDLTLVWAGIIAVGVMVYVILDGFDLGVGILFPLAKSHRHRDMMMNSVTPFWDGNETWLVMGGTALLAAFPKAYAVLLPALYLPLLTMVIALVFRGVAFEFRFKAGPGHRVLWDISFSFGSALAAFCQGLVLGSVVHGVPVQNGAYAGGAFDWLTPFSLTTGLAVMTGYALLGATWLIHKTEHRLQNWSYRMARRLLPLLLLFIAIVSVWTALSSEAIAERWFSLPNFYILSQVPLITVLLAAGTGYCLVRRIQGPPFVLGVALFLLSYIGLVISIWPYIVPRAITFREAAAPAQTQWFLLAGFLVFMPMVFIYTILGYRVFGGKVREDEGYH